MEASVGAFIDRLSDRSVILICRRDPSPATAPAWAARLCPEGARAVSGPLSPGRGKLDLIAFGARQPEALVALWDGRADTPLRRTARQVFGRLGQGLEDAASLARLQAAQVDEQRTHQQTTEMVHFLRQKLEEAEARMQAALEAEACAIAAHSAEIGRNEALRSAQTRIEAEIKSRIEADAKTRIAELAHNHALQLKEIETLTRKLRGSEATKDKLRGSEATKDRKLVAAKAEAKELRRRIDAMCASSSWRITAPIRRVKMALSRRGLGGGA